MVMDYATLAGKYDTGAVYAVRQYTWFLLQQAFGMNTYRGLIPIINVGQMPEFEGSQEAFLVYGYTTIDVDNLITEEIGYSVFHHEASSIDKILRLLGDAFSRYNASAKDVNEWGQTLSPKREWNFRYFTTGVVQSADSTDEDESSILAGYISIQYQYSINSPFARI